MFERREIESDVDEKAPQVGERWKMLERNMLLILKREDDVSIGGSCF